MVAVPACSAFTENSAEPLAGIVRVWATVATVGEVLSRKMSNGVASGGVMVAVIIPLVPGANAIWLGDSDNLDVDMVALMLAVLGVPFIVVTVIVSVPAERAVISALIWVSVAVTFFMETRPFAAATVCVVRRFCPFMVTLVGKPTKRTLGVMDESTGGFFAVLALVIAVRLPSAS